MTLKEIGNVSACYHIDGRADGLVPLESGIHVFQRYITCIPRGKGLNMGKDANTRTGSSKSCLHSSHGMDICTNIKPLWMDCRPVSSLHRLS